MSYFETLTDSSGTTINPATSDKQSNGSQKTQLVDPSGSNLINATSPIAARLTDGTTFYRVTTPSDTQPISAAALPLPVGAATSAKQDTGNTSVASIDGKLGSLGQKAMVGSAPVVLASDQTAIPVGQSGTWNVNNVNGTVSLPTGAATAALQTTGNGSLSTLATNLPAKGSATSANSLPVVIASDQATLPLPTGASTSALQTTANASLSSIDTKTPALVGGRQPVDGSGVTQPVSAASLPLPTGAATSALQTTISGQLPATLGAKATAASLAVNIASDQTVPVSAAALPLPTGAATSALQTTGNSSLATLATNVPAKGSATSANSMPVVIASDQAALPLPTGAATSANQTTELGYLATIVTNTPANGQKTMANSSPVVIASDQSAMPISAASLPLPTGSATSANQTTTNGYLATLATNSPAKGSATSANSTPVVIASDQAALPLPTGAATSALQTTGNSSLSTLATNVPAKGAATSANSMPVVIASDQAALPLPTGAATSALQTTGNTSLGTIVTNTGNIPAKGVATSANSTPVTIASDQVAIPVTPTDGAKATYSAAASAIAPAATATDVFTIYGSASKTIRVTRLVMSGSQTTGAVVPILVIKRSAVNTTGTSAAATAVPHDSNSAGATATVLSYTANPGGLGTAVGNVRARRNLIGAPAGTTGMSDQGIVLIDGARPEQCVVLRGTTQGLCVNLGSTTLTGGSLSYEITWTEE